MYHTLVANLSSGIRREKRDGREFLVARMSLLCPGILNGSQGPVYYPAEEIARSAEAWNDVAITANHPQVNGRQASVGSPGVLERQGIGVVQAAVMAGCLKAEGWFDVEKTRQVDNRIYDALVAGRQLELSTGLHLDKEHGGDGPPVARNYRPDHLAILPDQIGACSVNDGCGVLVNQEGETMGMFDAVSRGTRKPRALPSHEEIVASLEAEEARRAGVSTPTAAAPAPRRRPGPTPLPSHQDLLAELEGG